MLSHPEKGEVFGRETLKANLFHLIELIGEQCLESQTAKDTYEMNLFTVDRKAYLPLL